MKIKLISVIVLVVLLAGVFAYLNGLGAQWCRPQDCDEAYNVCAYQSELAWIGFEYSNCHMYYCYTLCDVVCYEWEEDDFYHVKVTCERDARTECEGDL